MACEHLKKLIESSNELSPDLEKHLEECQGCQSWLDSQIAIAPLGLETPNWHKAPARCFPEKLVLEKIIDKSPINSKNNNRLSGFFKNLKHGMALGSIVAIILVLANVMTQKVSNNKNHESSIENYENSVEFAKAESFDFLPSFLSEDNYFEDISFLEENTFEVESFVQNNYEIDFSDINEEEELWSEELSG